jgi:pre-mRNA-processing factor 39
MILMRNQCTLSSIWLLMFAFFQSDIEVISLVYRSFLLEFPLCHGYWIKYAAHKARLCTYEDVVEVYEQAVQAVPHSVDLWVSYCGFGMSVYEDPALIRR